MKLDWLARPRPVWLDVLLVLGVTLFGWVLCTRGLILSDEGYLLLQSWDLGQGRVLYRDMDSFVAPGVWFLLAAAFAIFGPSVFVSRMVALAAFVALIVLTERLVSRHTSRATGLVCAGCMLLFSVWAFPAWTFAFYSPLAVLFALLGLDRLLAWYDRGSQAALVACGASLGLSIVFKQNYGVFALLGAVLGFAVMGLDRLRGGGARPADLARGLGLAAAGVLAAGLPVLVQLAASGALAAAWQSLVIHPFEFAGQHDIAVAPLSRAFGGEVFATPVERLTYLSFAQLNTPPIAPLHAGRVVQRMHVLLYWWPLAIFVAGLALSLRPLQRRVLPVLFSVTAVCGGVYLGLFPRADFNHLVNVYQAVIVAGAFTLHEAGARVAERSPRAARWLGVTVGIVIAAYCLVAASWFFSLRARLATPVGGPRGGVLIGQMDAENLEQMLGAVERNSEPGEPVLTVPDLAMLNFLTDRPMPSAYYNLYEHHIAFDGGRAVVEGAEEAGVSLAITRYDNFFSDRTGLLEYAPVLADYLLTRFDRVTLGGNDDYIVLLRRDVPLERLPSIDVLAHCEPGDAPPGAAVIRHHLLFSALYHASREGREIAPEGTVTRCNVRVPERGGRLTLEVGYRQPFKVSRGATLHARVRLEEDGGARDIAAKSFRLVPRTGNDPQLPYRRLAIDLDPFAGREITLVFHTRLDGEVRVHPLDFKDFALVYRDVRLESREAASP